MPGLHVIRKRTRAGDTWYVYAWRGGPCIHKADGPRPVVTQAILAAAMQARTSGKPSDTLDALIEAYKADPAYEELAASTKRDYRLWLSRISDRFGSAPLSAFEDHRMRREVIMWRNQWSGSPRSADKASVMMATLLGWGVDQSILSLNVAAKIKQLHHADRSDMIWERKHMRAFASAPAHLRDALILAGLTGLRLGDLVKLDWSQVGKTAIIIVTSKRKGRAVIPITPTLRRHLDKREWREGKVLRNSRGKGWTGSGLGGIFQKAKPDWFDRTIHDLRGTFVTDLCLRGFTDQEIAMIVGWTAQRVAAVRARYVNEASIVVSLAARMSA